MRRIVPLILAAVALSACGGQSLTVVNGSEVELSVVIAEPGGTSQRYTVAPGGSTPAHGGQTGYWTVAVVVTADWVKRLDEVGRDLDLAIGSTSSSATELQRYSRSRQMLTIAEAMRGKKTLGFSCGRRVGEGASETVTITVARGAGFACG